MFAFPLRSPVRASVFSDRPYGRSKRARMAAKARVANKPKTQKGPTFAELLASEPARRAAAAPVNGPPPRKVLELDTEAAPLVVSMQGERCEAMAPGTSVSALRELKQGKQTPQLTIDVHGLTSIQALRAVDALLQSALDSELRTLLIVHGRGLHSGPAGPVLQGAIVEHLSRVRSQGILCLCSAPAKWGGPGALLVRLRRQR